MNLLRNIISFGFTPTLSQTLQKTYKQINIITNQPLPPEYHQLILLPSPKIYTEPQLFSQVVTTINKATTAPVIIKSFTIIFNAIRTTLYNHNFLMELQHLQLPVFDKNQERDQWVSEVAISCNSYLVRLPSIGQVFHRALKAKEGDHIDFASSQADLFRLMNIVGLLFPKMNTVLNTVGRYYMKTNLYFLQFYRVIREQLLLSYNYMRLIIERFITGYKECDEISLDLFLSSLSQIQLLCDKIQEFLLNKYFKGRAPPKKIYFIQEQIQEIKYFLKQLKAERNSSKSKQKLSDFNFRQSQGLTNSTEQQIFGEFQHQ